MEDEELQLLLLRGFLESSTYQLGPMDKGFAITVLNDFFNYLEENGYDIKPKN